VTVIDGSNNTTTAIADPNYFFGQLAVNPATNRIYVSDGGNGGGNGILVIDGFTNATTRITDPNAKQPNALAVNPVTNKIYVVNESSNNITVIDGATNQFTTITDPHAATPVAIAVNSITNKIYVANRSSNNVTVIDGATNQVSTISGLYSPYGVAVNWVTNEIYVTNNGGQPEVTVIGGLTQETTNVDCPNAASAANIAIDVASNLIFVTNASSDNISVIDGVTKGCSTTQDPNAIAPLFVAVNPVTQRAYVPNGNQNITVITELTTASIPLEVAIQPLSRNATKNQTPTFTFKATDNFAPNPTVIDGVWYQVDTWQGKWSATQSVGSGTYKGKIGSPLALGMHVLYAYATDGQEATATNTGVGTSPLVGNIAAYPFLVY
jgi:YVTN family beta-propeller protein